MYKFQVEKWADVLPEMRPLFNLLWAEVALDKDKFRAVCDEEGYAKCDALGMIHVVTVRKDLELVGFHVSIITPHLHYKGAGPFAFTDMYFIHPKHRRGTGAKLLAFMKESLKPLGIRKAYLSHKVAHNRSELFTALGWKACDVVYCAVIE